MAYYAYKKVCNQLPEEAFEAFEETYGRECDMDPNYNGDYWTVTAIFIQQLIDENAELRAKLSKEE